MSQALVALALIGAGYALAALIEWWNEWSRCYLARAG